MKMEIKMRTLIVTAASAALFVAGSGCQQQQKGETAEAPFTGPDEQTTLNESMVRTLFTQSQRNAIIAEHTIYPHHFERNSTDLTVLGEKQVEVLASAYRSGPGPLSIIRGGTSNELYDGRVKTVIALLADQGVDTARLTVGEYLPDSGTIMTSDRAVEAVRPEQDRGHRRSGASSRGGNGGDGTQMQTREESNRYE